MNLDYSLEVVLYLENNMAKLNSNINIKDLFQKLFKKSQELTFFIFGFLILIIIIWYVVSNISFLVTGFNKAFNIDIQKNQNNLEFNIEGAKNTLREDLE
ncbi:MAG: hypothetical protein COV57_03450 [Candidatus Liptonbacteria bacterium CG11_big_fil_rev_8_21_14_0_20_35_14]|uniref:Uncharacterized protein n=1 Tax=Candidatus Liptonbacteria bacterium CG11_big_fil_rev_8_21_14_0_20_35_14 TaxID=1974634 RepID=A0A2H0N6U2_9BACT|nr:MAG: hypothetical protein COV57_03450 [Candidatus Liptonbacteria bacterium CG11_big_fil_rev_8_21_14_0_20_35_14]